MNRHAYVHLKGGKPHYGESQPIIIPYSKWHKAANDEAISDQP